MSLYEMKGSCVFEEQDCDIRKQKQYETVMCLGNGYLGMRSAFCEEYSSQSRLTLIAGLYDQQPSEVEELMPLPDVTALSISVNGKKIGPLSEGVTGYSRTLDLQNALLSYSYTVPVPGTDGSVTVTQRRLVSLSNRHLAAFETVISADCDVDLSVTSFVNGKQLMNGTQHTFEEERTVLDGDLLWYGGRASVAGTSYRVGSRMKIFLNGEEQTGIQRYSTGRRLLSSTASVHLTEEDEVRLIRYALFYTENDPEWGGKDADSIRADMVCEMDTLSLKSFDTHLADSAEAWAERWRRCDIEIDSADPTENLKTRLAMYHSIIMCPDHDEQVSIAAKGLTGPGYAGHVFWDCEIFNLPFFTYTNPSAARKLCTYRYHTLDGARRKAKEYGYRGAMYPWESSSRKGDEQCPVCGGYSADNTLRHITCGEIEHHVVCDVAYGTNAYAQITKDEAFMEQYGCEIFFETADFWQSRLEYKEDKDRYEICGVTGPDEYQEYVDNNTYTNYLAAWNMQTALDKIEYLKENSPALFEKLENSIGLTRLAEDIRAKLPKLYLPQPREDGLIPQNDSYLDLNPIDLTKYKTSGINRLICREYSMHQLGELMVSKQADLIQLIVLMPELFPRELIEENLAFYESRCLHDSSLSLSAFSIVAVRIGRMDMAYDFFRGALNTDFGEGKTDSGAGIHAANCGGIWQDIVFGFMGVDGSGDALSVNPHLPDVWNRVSARLFWAGCELKITVDKQSVTVEKLSGKAISVSVCGKEYTLDSTVTVAK